MKIKTHRGPLIKCPKFTKKGDMIYKTVCGKCKDRDNCETWRK